MHNSSKRVQALNRAQGSPWTAGQGAIEYLLIIGAAILVVAIVTIAITSVLQQGQIQTDTGSASAYDSLHKLAVGGLGYQIEFKLKDASSGDFPVPNNVDCNDPVTNLRFDCFYEKTIAYLYIDGSLLAQYDLTGVRQPTLYTYTFKGDPNTKHRLQLVYGDCWAGYSKISLGTPNRDLINNMLYKINAPGIKCSDPSIPDGGLCSSCNDNNLWDKNIDLNFLKIVRSDGTELPVEYGVKWSTPMVDMNFQ
ncbi:MAG: hypothetical protein WCW44_01725 [archaeon]|jgi:hypothetical protein